MAESNDGSVGLVVGTCALITIGLVPLGHWGFGMGLQDFAHLGDSVASIALILGFVAIWQQQRSLRMARDELNEMVAAQRSAAALTHTHQLAEAYANWASVIESAANEVFAASGDPSTAPLKTRYAWMQGQVKVRSALYRLLLHERDIEQATKAKQLSVFGQKPPGYKDPNYYVDQASRKLSALHPFINEVISAMAARDEIAKPARAMRREAVADPD